MPELTVAERLRLLERDLDELTAAYQSLLAQIEGARDERNLDAVFEQLSAFFRDELKEFAISEGTDQAIAAIVRVKYPSLFATLNRLNKQAAFLDLAVRVVKFRLEVDRLIELRKQYASLTELLDIITGQLFPILAQLRAEAVAGRLRAEEIEYLHRIVTDSLRHISEISDYLDAESKRLESSIKNTIGAERPQGDVRPKI